MNTERSLPKSAPSGSVVISAVHAAMALAVNSLWNGSAGPLLEPTMVTLWLPASCTAEDNEGFGGEVAAGGGERRRQLGGEAHRRGRCSAFAHWPQQSTIPPRALQPGRGVTPEQTFGTTTAGWVCRSMQSSDHQLRKARRRSGAA